MKPLLEVSWEVCNKVGGIYTVITSKLKKTTSNYDYLAIGPYFPSEEFEEHALSDELLSISNQLKEEGIELHYGTWKPYGVNVVLIGFARHFSVLNGLKKELWEKYSISSIRAGYDYDEPLVWSHAVSRFIDLYTQKRKAVVQCHEWMSGLPCMLLEGRRNIKTVFTTHATILGRTLVGNGRDLYSEMESIDPDRAAEFYNIESKHGIEKQSALHADVFTTVSKMTAHEAKLFLKVNPEIITPNGLLLENFPSSNEYAITKKKVRSKLESFLEMYLGAYYAFDSKEYKIIFTSGRYEFRSKGLDIFIKALGEINKKNSKKIVVFFWIPAGTHSIHPKIIAQRNALREIKQLESAPTKNQLGIDRFKAEFKQEGNAPLCTHLLENSQDAIIRAFYQAGLENKKEDCVKVIFYPLYLNGNDGLLDLAYYDAVQGCDLGIFASYYEPWGYTPLESAALFVPAITSDLAGFGQFIQGKGKGIKVLQRAKKSDEESVKELESSIIYYLNANLSKEARAMAKLADWNELFSAYENAYQ